MTLSIADDPCPIRLRQGVPCVGGTRVTLDTVIRAYQRGLTPEQIVYDFDTLALADIYTVIGYYLRHRAEVDAYLDAREQRAEEVRREIEARFLPDGPRERLLRRRGR